LENTLLAYHRQTELTKQLGWFHDIIQGNFFSAAYLGDAALLRKYLKFINDKSFKNKTHTSSSEKDEAYRFPTSIDALDKSGMSALHWACLRGHEIIVRILLDRGADSDVFQKGMNTPLLLAAAFGHETIARLLIENGADIHTRNSKGHDAVFMAVLYGHATKGLPWLLQLFTARGLNLNDVDSDGATPLHLCAARNLARPVRMLVDSGADVNAKHGETQLTPLQMACSHIYPDVETIRSFLDKGGYPNWKDSSGRTAFEISMRNHPNNRNNPNISLSPGAPPPPPVVFGNVGSDVNIHDVLVGSNGNSKLSDENNSGGGGFPGSNPDSMSMKSSMNQNDPKWRAMEETISVVGDWAVRALPALLVRKIIFFLFLLIF
jgi:ankyrin repeat protein